MHLKGINWEPLAVIIGVLINTVNGIAGRNIKKTNDTQTVYTTSLMWQRNVHGKLYQLLKILIMTAIIDFLTAE